MSTTTHSNPGTTNPADQSYPSVPVSRAISPPASASVVNSDGGIQLPGLKPAWAAQSAVIGLPVEVQAGSVSHVRASEPVVAEVIPSTRTVNGNPSRPGGLPANVMIR